MKLIAVVKNPISIARYLTAAGEPTDVPSRSQDREPPYWKAAFSGGKRSADGAGGTAGGRSLRSARLWRDGMHSRDSERTCPLRDRAA